MILFPDLDGFEAFVRESSGPLLGLAMLLTSDRGQAEDLLQVALVRTASHWRAARHNPRVYTRRVLVNLAKNRWRDRSRRPQESQDLTGVDPVEAATDVLVADRDELFRLVALLPMAQRKVLVLRYYEDLSVGEVAVILGCSEGTVKSRSNRALTTLRALLAESQRPNLVENHHAQ